MCVCGQGDVHGVAKWTLTLAVQSTASMLSAVVSIQGKGRVRIRASPQSDPECGPSFGNLRPWRLCSCPVQYSQRGSCPLFLKVGCGVELDQRGMGTPGSSGFSVTGIARVFTTW